MMTMPESVPMADFGQWEAAATLAVKGVEAYQTKKALKGALREPPPSYAPAYAPPTAPPTATPVQHFPAAEPPTDWTMWVAIGGGVLVLGILAIVLMRR